MQEVKAVMDSGDQIKKFQDFFEARYKVEIAECIRMGRKSLVVDFAELPKFDLELAEHLLDYPDDYLKAASVALETQFDFSNAIVRLVNLPKTCQTLIRDIDPSATIGKFISVYGMVRRKSDVKPKTTIAKFECPACGTILVVLMKDKFYEEPKACGCGRKGGFTLVSQDRINQFSMVLEETPDSISGGSDLKKIPILMKDDLASPILSNKIHHGNVVRINGILRETFSLSKTGRKLSETNTLIEANAIEFIEENWEDIIVTDEEIPKIKELASNPFILEQLSEVIFKDIYGFDMEKKSIVLQQFGGVRAVSGNIVHRGDIHILLIGDPGAAKSTMLKIVQKVAPKARYASGRGSSGVGLTAAVVKDDILGGWTLEAGVIPLANSGIALIDELDKIDEDERKSLNEALSEQTVTISKANIQATLKAQTTILAAANPKYGRFNPYEDIYKQFDLDPTLVNRFDLVFTIKDVPDADRDWHIAKSMLSRQRKNVKSIPAIDPLMVKKYISYAKRIDPECTEEVENKIANFFRDTRATAAKSESGMLSIPITPRQVESIRRLSQASARLKLSDKVELSDVQLAIDIVLYFLKQVGIDPETGKMDIDQFTMGVSTSARNKYFQIRDVISELESQLNGPVPIMDVIRHCQEKGFKETEVEEMIVKLKRNGDILEPRAGFLKHI